MNEIYKTVFSQELDNVKMPIEYILYSFNYKNIDLNLMNIIILHVKIRSDIYEKR